MAPSRRILFSLAAVYAAGGVASAFMQHDKALDFALGVATVAAVYTWCRQESLERRSFAPGRSALWAALFSPVGLPVYFLRTRRPVPAMLSSVKALALYIGLGVVMLSTGFLTSMAAGLLAGGD